MFTINPPDLYLTEVADWVGSYLGDLWSVHVRPANVVGAESRDEVREPTAGPSPVNDDRNISDGHVRVVCEHVRDGLGIVVDLGVPIVAVLPSGAHRSADSVA